MTSPSSRHQAGTHVVLPQGAPRLTPAAAAELLEILLEAHQELLSSRPDAA
ncbi:hypothetical protein GCM10022226_06430 [Sphaerisporangium flaviroseum]|uniref:Uncharacterized protein n=1 Tax=Sphaerisporangium flaviroseum TaxID=509199 RepID=A0ABP7HBF3_9ACTN